MDESEGMKRWQEVLPLEGEQGLSGHKDFKELASGVIW